VKRRRRSTSHTAVAMKVLVTRDINAALENTSARVEALSDTRVATHMTAAVMAKRGGTVNRAEDITAKEILATVVRKLPVTVARKVPVMVVKKAPAMPVKNLQATVKKPLVMAVIPIALEVMAAKNNLATERSLIALVADTVAKNNLAMPVTLASLKVTVAIRMVLEKDMVVAVAMMTSMASVDRNTAQAATEVVRGMVTMSTRGGTELPTPLWVP